MKNSLSDLYEKILLSEAQKNDLTSPSNVVVGDLKSNEEVFGEKPEVEKGPEKISRLKNPFSEHNRGPKNLERRLLMKSLKKEVAQ